MKNEIENIFKQRFENFETVPSAGLFDAIQAKREKKKRAIWIWSAAGICLLAALSIGIWQANSSSIINSPELATDSKIPAPEEKANDVRLTTPEVTEDGLAIKEATNALAAEKRGDDKALTRVRKTIDSETKKVPLDRVANKKESGSGKLNSLPTQSNTAEQTERARLFAQIIKENTASEGKGKLYIRGSQRGTENPFESSKSEDKTPTTNRGDGAKEDIAPLQTVPMEGSLTNNPSSSDLDNSASNDASLDPTDADGSTSAPFPVRKLVALSKWRIEATGGLGYAFRDLNGSSEDISVRNNTENGQLSYAAQLNGIYQFNPKWNVQLGIDYRLRQEGFTQNIAEQTTYTTRTETRERLVIHPIFGEQIEEYQVEVNDTLTTAGYLNEYDNSFTSISIPLALEYTLYTSGKWKINAKLGVDATLIQRADGVAIANNVMTEYRNIPYLRNNLWSGRLGIGVAYRATNRISLIAYPQVTYQLHSSLKSEAGYTQRDYSIFSHFGVRIGL